jgi:hypothetical protein
MVNIARQDIANGHGLFFLDPHADAIDDLLSCIGGQDMEWGGLLNPEILYRTLFFC